MVEFNFHETFNVEEYLYFYQDILTEERLKKELDFQELNFMRIGKENFLDKNLKR